MLKYRKMEAADDELIAKIIRANLDDLHLSGLQV